MIISPQHSKEETWTNKNWSSNVITTRKIRWNTEFKGRSHTYTDTHKEITELSASQSTFSQIILLNLAL